jgi:molybdopterin/thiamine biosynthesis adenylyltransferase
MPAETRYARQTVMPNIGTEGQRRLAQAHVLVVGAGGLGSPILLYLAAAGVGTLGVVDGDRVHLSNLNRQILYTAEDLGHSKVPAAVQHLRARNSEIALKSYAMYISEDNGPDLIQGYDLVVEASDNLETKDLINQLCVRAGIPLVWGAVQRFEGQMGVYQPGHACRRCIFPTMPQPGTYPSPSELGILGVTAGVIGTLQAMEALKIILGVGKPLTDHILVWDGLTTCFEVVAVEAAPECPTCASHTDAPETEA